MPRFYFDVCDGTRFVPDDESMEFDGLDDAEHEASAAAAEIGRDRLPTGDAREVTVKVKNERHRRLLTVRVLMEVDRVEPQPERPLA
jgi:hypothetical protein